MELSAPRMVPSHARCSSALTGFQKSKRRCASERAYKLPLVVDPVLQSPEPVWSPTVVMQKNCSGHLLGRSGVGFVAENKIVDAHIRKQIGLHRSLLHLATLIHRTRGVAFFPDGECRFGQHVDFDAAVNGRVLCRIVTIFEPRVSGAAENWPTTEICADPSGRSNL